MSPWPHVGSGAGTRGPTLLCELVLGHILGSPPTSYIISSFLIAKRGVEEALSCAKRVSILASFMLNQFFFVFRKTQKSISLLFQDSNDTEFK